jgi:hypothetical protein
MTCHAAVISSSGKPVSAKQNFSPARPHGRAILCKLLGFALFIVLYFLPQPTHADSLEESARLLARKVWASIHGASVSLEFRNISSLGSAEFAGISTAFQEELQRRGVKILAADAAASLVVNVTQNPTEYIGVVQIQRKENTETVIETIGLVNGPAAPEPAFRLVLHREFLFSSDSPIVDVMLDNDAKHAYALGVQEISAYEWRAEQWTLTRSEHLPTHRPPERGGRGFILQGVDSQRVYFPGEFCHVSKVSGEGWSCEKYADLMPVPTVPSEAVAGKKLGAWISAAQFETDEKIKVVVTGQDGLARLYEDGADPAAVFANWGSQIASVYSGCGSGWQLLVTGKGDWTTTDAIEAMDIKDRRAQSVSASMEFAGPIVALHAWETRAADNPAANAKAVAVDRNLQTGRYEAYQLSITCSR